MENMAEQLPLFEGQQFGPLCGCGCGRPTSGRTYPQMGQSRYIRGHQFRLGAESFNAKPTYQEALKLIEEGELAPIEIARRTGYTRERIRQLELKYFNRTGRERAVIRRQPEWELRQAAAKARMLAVPFCQAAMAQGFEVELEPIPYQAGKFLYYRRYFRVNGKLCWVGAGTRRKLAPSLHLKSTEGYAVFRPPQNCRADTRFLIYDCQHLGLWLIVPKERAPKSQNMVRLVGEHKIPGAYTKRHDWKSYVNAWHLLEEDAQLLGQYESGYPEDIKLALAPLDTMRPGQIIGLQFKTVQRALNIMQIINNRNQAQWYTGKPKYYASLRGPTLLRVRREDGAVARNGNRRTARKTLGGNQPQAESKRPQAGHALLGT